MANKRELKKSVKQMVYEIMDDCDFVIVSGGKNAENANQLMDDAVDFYETTIESINKTNDKKEFKSIREKIENSAIDFVNRLNELNK